MTAVTIVGRTLTPRSPHVYYDPQNILLSVQRRTLHDIMLP